VKFAIITCSDTRTIETDEAGKALTVLIGKRDWEVALHKVVADDFTAIGRALTSATDNNCVDIVLTCGGTGFSKRDVTPEATMAIGERLAPGIAEAIRAQSMAVTRRAMLSRGQAVIRGDSLIINLPGSTKAATESFTFVEDQLEHAIEMLHGGGHS
jgi:molybdenum cofactor synthesis domain-containing protein